MELLDILRNAKDGVIYVNLGSTITEELPKEMLEQLIKVFRHLEQDIIWKYGDKLEHVPANVHLVEWVPQQALLKHPKLMMVISHASHLTYIEAMFYGVPLIGIPVFGDQLLTMDVAAARGRGIKVHYTEKLAFRLKDAINEVLGNFTYKFNAKEVSSILHRPLVPPSQELRYWVELVISTRGAVHLRSPALPLNIIERYHIDVAGLIFLMYWFFTKVAKLVKVYWDDFGTDTGAEEREKIE